MDTEIETYTVERDNERDITFTGERIGFGTSRTPYKDDRWTELSLYKTKGGKFVCSEIGYTKWQGEQTRYKAEVCETTEEVVEFFGHGWVSKELYSDAGIDTAINID